MSDVSQGPGWWLASDGKWYPPHTAPQATLPPDAGTAYPGYPQAQPAASPFDQGGVAAHPYAQPYAQPTGEQYADQYGVPAAAYPPATAQYQAATGAPLTTGYGGYPTSAPGADGSAAAQPAAAAYGGTVAQAQPDTMAGGTSPGSSVMASQALTSVRRPRWQPWLALAGIALVVWGAGQGMLAWAQWHMVQAQFSTFGTVTQGHVGMVLSAAGTVVAGIAAIAIALTLDRR